MQSLGLRKASNRMTNVVHSSAPRHVGGSRRTRENLRLDGTIDRRVCSK